MNNIKAALAELVRTFGFNVCTNMRDGLELYWGLYTQGSGVCFRATIGSYKPMVEALRQQGKLDTAAKLIDLIENHELKATVSLSKGNYTHAQMMDVEIEGPSTDQADWEATAALIEEMRSTLTELKDAASEEAFTLITNYDLLQVSAPVQLKLKQTAHFQVRVECVPPGDGVDGPLDWNLEGFEPSDAVEEMKRCTERHGAFVAGDVRATVSRRDDPSDEWEEVATFELGGTVLTLEDFRVEYAREAAVEAIKQARIELENNLSLLEAA